MYRSFGSSSSSTHSSPDRLEFDYGNASPQRPNTPSPKGSDPGDGRLARSEARSPVPSFTQRIIDSPRRSNFKRATQSPPLEYMANLRAAAIKMAQGGQSRLLELKQLHMTAAARQEQTEALITTVSENMKKAFTPGSTLTRVATRRQIAGLFDDVVDAYGEAVQENARLISNNSLLRAQLPEGAVEMEGIIDPSADGSGWNLHHTRFGSRYRSNKSSTNETNNSRDEPNHKSDDDAEPSATRYEEAKAKRDLRGCHKNLDEARGEIQSLRTRLELSNQTIRALREELERGINGRGNAQNRLGQQNGDFHGPDRTHPGIAQVRNRILDIEKRLRSDQKKERRAHLAGSNHVPADGSLIREMAEVRDEVDRLGDELLDAREERDEAIERANSADKRALNVKQDAAAMPPDAEDEIAGLHQDILGRDRYISDLETVRNNLRAEVTRRGGRVVGDRGQVSGERYDPVRWEEAGRREAEGLPRLYRDAWGADSDANVPRSEWPPEYRPDNPEPEGGNDRESLDKDIGRKIAGAYQRVCELVPDLEARGGDPLAWLKRIFQEAIQNQQDQAEEIARLRTYNESLAEINRELELRDRQRAEAVRRSALSGDRMEGVVEGPLPDNDQEQEGSRSNNLSNVTDPMSIDSPSLLPAQVAVVPTTVAPKPGRGRPVRGARNPSPRYYELSPSPKKRKAASLETDSEESEESEEPPPKRVK